MKKTAAVAVLALLTAALAFPHAGEVHTYMGTVTALHDDGSFVMKTTEGKEIAVAIAASTKFLKADGTAGAAADLAAGKRVVVKMSKDGRTATTVKIAKG